MTDPNEIVETATQAQVAVRAAGGTAAALGVLGALVAGLVKLWTAIFGTAESRAAAREAEAIRRQEAHERAANLALRMADRSDEQTASHRRALGTCEEQLRAMREQQTRQDERMRRQDERMEQLEDELRTLGAERGALRGALTSLRIELDEALSRCAHLEREQALSSRMLALYMRTGSTPPDGTPSLNSLETPDHG